MKPNGYFLCKLFQDQENFEEMRSLLEKLFRSVYQIKPTSSREESPESYLLAMKYYGNEMNSEEQATKTSNSRVETDRKKLEQLLEEARRVRTKKKIPK